MHTSELNIQNVSFFYFVCVYGRLDVYSGKHKVGSGFKITGGKLTAKKSHDHSLLGQEVRLTSQNLVIKHVILVKRERHFTSAQ